MINTANICQEESYNWQYCTGLATGKLGVADAETSNANVWNFGEK